ncbi:aspartyl protease family protein [Rhizorhabdus argentea]|uniref:aspartyl protease family protein n=1 Tax=Rhizorhabdus argentea TaxID=1387174 RepID=UPI0030EE78A6
MKTQIDGVEASFVADSGAVFSMISPGWAAQLKLKLRPAPNWLTMFGVGGTFSTSIATIKNFGLAGQTVPNVEFLVGGSEAQATGLLGQNFLSLADAEYDLGGGMIRLFQSKGCGKLAMAYWVKDMMFSVIDIEPMSGGNRHIIGVAYVNGVKIRVLFDTGAESSILTQEAAKRAGITPDTAGVTERGAATGLGRKVTRSWIAPQLSFKIGAEEIRSKGLRFADLANLGGAGIDMLLGADFFLSHRVFVANSQHKLYFTYSGGKVFDTDAPKALIRESQDAPTTAWIPPSDDRAAPIDADGYSRRGAVMAAQRNFAAAVSDFSRAIEMAPGEAQYLQQRAMVYIEQGLPALANADLDLAMQKKPDFIDARLSRAMLHLVEKDNAAARADLDAASKAAAKEADQRFAFAELYSALEDWSAAIEQLDLWIAIHPVDSRKPVALNERCWARALLNQALPAALEDCNMAIRLRPKTVAFLDSRGLVRLRMGDFDKAIADYDTVLATQPKLGWSLLGRGLARRRSGKKAEGKADIDAGIAIDPTLAEQAKKYGIIASTEELQ